jgi:thiol-disulfide isomerase/thioredoxin
VVVEPKHLRLDFAWDVTRAEATHEEDCPDIGPICGVRKEPPQLHHTALWSTEIRVLAEYGLLPNLAVQGMLPVRLIDTHTVYTDLANHPVTLDYQNIHHRNEDLVGLGDGQLLMHGGLLLGGLQVSARAGVSIPLGRMQPNPFKLTAQGLPHEHIQFGTGTFDPVLAADVAREFGSWSAAFFAVAQAPLYADGYGYQAGARLFAGLLAQSPLGTEHISFRLGLSAYHEFPERWDGQVPTEDGNQGRTDLYLAPGITFPLAGEWGMSVDVRTRVYGYTVNAQLSMPVILSVSVGRLFHFEEAATDQVSAPSPTADGRDVVTAGEAVPLEPVRGQWTVFDFWAPWCEACKVLGRDLEALAARRPDLAVRRVNIVDFDSPIARQELQGVRMLPHVRVLDPQGKLVWEGSGTPDEILSHLKQ